jgi:short-subunit dehydrogenase
MKNLSGRVVAITGAGSGIGRATALAFAERGCDVAVIDVSAEPAEETVRLVRAAGRRASAHTVDVRDGDAVESAAAEVVSAHGACHVVVANAGVTSAGEFTAESVEDLHWIVDVNVWGVVHTVRAFLPALLDADEGHVVTLSSMVGLLGLPHNVSYSLTKGAVRSFSEALRAELVTTGVGVTVVFPGAIHTNITESARGNQAGRLAEMGRSRLAPVVMRPPSSVARAIVRGVERNRARVVVGPDAHAVSALTRLLPGRSGLVGRLTIRLVD